MVRVWGLAAICAPLLVASACSPGREAATADRGPGEGVPGADGGAPPDAGAPDAGPGAPDAGIPPDAGPSPHRPGGLGAGPWPAASLTVYGSMQGLFETPISASVDEAENLWVVTRQALYLLRPGEKTFHRYTAADGLHVGPGFTEPPHFTLVEGGGPGECFVGYTAHDTHDPPDRNAHTALDPIAHLGKMDQVLLLKDLRLEVRRYDLHNSNDGNYYETRTILSMVYDHFQHPGELYVGSNHGITRILPSKWRLPATDAERSFPISVEREWYADHVHPWVCEGGPCTGPSSRISFGDFYGLALADDGRLWMGGLSSAGAIGWRAELSEWVQSWQGHNPFTPAFGDPYPGNPPVFNPPREGDWVNLRAVAPAPDGVIWFASGEVESWRGPTYGLAAWDGHRFTIFDPLSLGSSEYNILELKALPDGKLVLGFPNSGLLLWKPGEAKGRRLTMGEGLPGNSIGRLYLDRMVNPAALYVPTDGGLAVLRGP